MGGWVEEGKGEEREEEGGRTSALYAGVEEAADVVECHALAFLQVDVDEVGVSFLELAGVCGEVGG